MKATSTSSPSIFNQGYSEGKRGEIKQREQKEGEMEKGAGVKILWAVYIARFLN